MTNPEKAIDAILDDEHDIGGIVVKPLTIARYALLEKTKSPILTGEGETQEIMVSLYIMSAEIEDLAGKSPDEIVKDAYAWADTIDLEVLNRLMKEIQTSLEDVKYLFPDGNGEESGKKKAPTAG